MQLCVMQIALVAIIIFTYVAITVWQDGCVGSRLLLTLGGARHLLHIPLLAIASVPQGGEVVGQQVVPVYVSLLLLTTVLIPCNCVLETVY